MKAVVLQRIQKNASSGSSEAVCAPTALGSFSQCSNCPPYQGVVVMDIYIYQVIEYQISRQLLSNCTIKAKQSDQSMVQIGYCYAQSRIKSDLGEYIDRLTASRILTLALK